uniref:PX domain-containing protein n=2 Tax=Musa acuminata subsp. malaccensis TaxID=214687 RepID=A0A804I047_MUSAM|nr:PREDICTED: uncharacterized protein LOC103972507 isoform X1 [Musa acuminata subsp. malaccensis]
MPANSPPKHRHDGTSPLPLGMDWSPPPKRWDGRNTIWPHNPQTGWSYCAMIPSWVVQTEPGTSQESFLNPIVFYRIHVGIQSPEGVSTSHGLLRRFSDFLMLYSALKKTFPRKDIPSAPPKHAFLRINSSRMLLEERRQALEEWMGKLLSDIDLSRSAPAAGFLELETAARLSFQNENCQLEEPSSPANATAVAPSVPARPLLSASVADYSAVPSISHTVASDICSENIDEISELGTPKKGKTQVSEASTEPLALVHDLVSSTIAIGDDLMGESSLEHPEDFIMSKLNHGQEYHALERQTIGGSSSRDRIESISDQNHDKLYGHSRKLSAESIGSDSSSIRGSEVSAAGVTNSIWEVSLDVPDGAEIPNIMDALPHLNTQVLNKAQIVLPIDQRLKLNRVIVNMQQRLVTARTDMEDLIARLNQEMAVKEYLTTKVKDLEVELEATEQKGTENLQQAILIEKERVTQMQWDMDELHRKCTEMEAKLTSEQNEKNHAESEKTTASDETELLLQEVHCKEEELQNMQKCLAELEMKSKADIKVLVKEVKSLRKSQAELREVLNQSLKEKTDLEVVLHREKQRWSNAKSANEKLLHECRVLHDRLQECNVNFLMDEDDKFTISSSPDDALDLLATSDDRIGLLLAEAQLLARDDEESLLNVVDARTSESSQPLVAENGDISISTDNQIRKMLTDMFIDNVRLRKQVNSAIRCALNTVIKPEESEESHEVPSRNTVLNRFL